MKKMNRILSAAAALGLTLTPAALADTISFSGNVEASNSTPVYAQIGGTVDSIDTAVGEAVSAGDVLATLRTTKVYATEAGTVTGIFGQPGDSVESVQTRYGAVMYVESNHCYTIAASTENAYNSTATKYVHVGESVYLSCYTDSGSHQGTGVITSITGTDYTVEVESGEFVIGETVSVFRSADHTSSTRIGRGTLSRTDPTGYSGSGTGSIVSLAVADGDSVQRGDLLYETLGGSYSAYYMSGTSFVAPTDGYVASIDVSEGAAVNTDSVVATVYPASAMRIAASVSESDLAYLSEGDPVSIEMSWNEDADISYDGVVTMISAIADSSSSSSAAANVEGDTSESSEVTYTVYIDFTPDANTRYGMSCVVTTLDDDAEATDDTQPVVNDETAESENS